MGAVFLYLSKQKKRFFVLDSQFAIVPECRSARLNDCQPAAHFGGRQQPASWHCHVAAMRAGCGSKFKGGGSMSLADAFFVLSSES
jgi:hypothetical protein